MNLTKMFVVGLCLIASSLAHAGDGGETQYMIGGENRDTINPRYASLFPEASDADITSVCRTAIGDNEANANSCLTEIQGKRYNAAALEVCGLLAVEDSSYLVSCLQKIANASLQDAAVRVCRTFMPGEYSYVASCFEKVANKSFESIDNLMTCTALESVGNKLYCIDSQPYGPTLETKLEFDRTADERNARERQQREEQARAIEDAAKTRCSKARVIVGEGKIGSDGLPCP